MRLVGSPVVTFSRRLHLPLDGQTLKNSIDFGVVEDLMLKQRHASRPR